MKYMSDALGSQDGILPDEDKVVRVHSHVTLDEVGEEFSYQIVEPHEVDVPNKRISKLSPVARALLGKRVGDKVMVQAPGGNFEFEIKAIKNGHQRHLSAGPQAVRNRCYSGRNAVGLSVG